METKSNFINELTSRVYNKVYDDQMRGLLIESKPLMETDELAEQIKADLDDYLTPDEQEQLLIEDLGSTDNEYAKSLIIKIAVEMAALNIHSAVYKALSDKDFVKDNPYSVFKSPRMFMLYKFYDEQLGIKLNPDNIGEPE